MSVRVALSVLSAVVSRRQAAAADHYRARQLPDQQLRSHGRAPGRGILAKRADVPTINQGHVKNPSKTHYLNATMAGNNTSPGIGPDGIYRDPWGNPYIITIDLNYDDKARDAFYRLPAVSADLSDTILPSEDSTA